MSKGFLQHEEIAKYLVIYEERFPWTYKIGQIFSHMWGNCSSQITLHTLYIVENFQRTSVPSPCPWMYDRWTWFLWENMSKTFWLSGSGKDGVIFHFKELLFFKRRPTISQTRSVHRKKVAPLSHAILQLHFYPSIIFVQFLSAGTHKHTQG